MTEQEPEQLGLPERRQPTPIPVPAGQGLAPTPLYAALWPRNGMVPCRTCQRANHETRLWCTACGHQMGVPLGECVCETCLRT